MISAVVLVRDRRRREPPATREVLVRSLGWLVSAVVAGVVHDVTVAGPGGIGLAAIGEETGCRIVEEEREADRLRAACDASKYSRLLIVVSGYQPGEGMIGELETFIRVTSGETSARLLAAPASAWQRLFRDRAPTIGLLAPTIRYRGLAGRDFDGFGASLKIKTLFATRAFPIR